MPGWSLDLTRSDPATGRAWDLATPAVQAKVKRMVLEQQPLFVIGSPPCTAFSQLQGLNNSKRDPTVVAQELAAACAHIMF